ncbi:MAG: M48 family metalloprotease [Saprospiraceae bacterium]
MKKYPLHSFLLLLSIILIAVACSRNPVTGKKELMLMSEKQEIALGQQYDPSVVSSYGVYEDEQMQQFIEAKGQKMAKISHRANLDYEFKVLDSPVVNAFAVPGGYVYFTRGIMAHFNNEAEFAGVLGHEIGHITARHSAKQQSRATLAQLGMVVGLVVSKDFRQFADAANQGLGLLFLKFGRDAESQSDRLGVEYSTEIGYDAKEMAGFFQTISRLQEQAGQSIPTFMSTHPNPVDRFNNVKQLAAKQQQADTKHSRYQVNRDSYLAMIDGLIYGEDPKQGYVENNVFYHPELKFQFPIPRNWRTANSPAQVQMAPEQGNAMMIFTLSGQKELQAAANEIVQNYKLTVKDSKNMTVNGMSAMAFISEQPNEQNPEGSLRLQTYLIKYSNMIYVFHGVSTLNEFSRYQSFFTSTMKNFKPLTDPSKINVKPEVVSIKTVNRNMTLANALQSFNMKSERMTELAILNGMELSAQVKAGSKIKIIVKQGAS